MNSDIVGWLRIRALDISYPVVQGKDNDYYLHRTFEKTDNFAGCLFVNSYNMGDFTDQNTIIYGHNMKNGSMFGKLSRILTIRRYLRRAVISGSLRRTLFISIGFFPHRW
ncbi:MAG: sortase domain-bontaining protein [Lachnospiraceae bacterium]